MSTLNSISKVVIPRKSIDFLLEKIRQSGEEGYELLALWAGKANGDSFLVQSTIIPKQTGYSIEAGLLYCVDGEELHRINVWLYENEMTLIAQIHSHPGQAYHSETDDRYPILATYGGFSIVVPDFGFGGQSIFEWATFRLSPEGIWRQLDYDSVISLFQII